MDDFNRYGKPVLHVQHKHPLSSCSRKGKVALKCKQKGIFQLLRKLEPNVEKGSNDREATTAAFERHSRPPADIPKVCSSAPFRIAESAEVRQVDKHCTNVASRYILSTTWQNIFHRKEEWKHGRWKGEETTAAPESLQLSTVPNQKWGKLFVLTSHIPVPLLGMSLRPLATVCKAAEFQKSAQHHKIRYQIAKNARNKRIS